jgi:putative hemolysin
VIRVKFVTMALGTLALAACVTSAPVNIGPGRYEIVTRGSNMPNPRALRKASSFCAQQGKQIDGVTQTAGGVLAGAYSTVTFSCK